MDPVARRMDIVETLLITVTQAVNPILEPAHPQTRSREPVMTCHAGPRTEIRFVVRDCAARSMGSVATRQIIAWMGASLRSEPVIRALCHLLPVGHAVPTSVVQYAVTTNAVRCLDTVVLPVTFAPTLGAA